MSRQLLGHVLGIEADGSPVEGEDPRTVCVECTDEDERDGPEVRDSSAYGDEVPYPECFRCQGVMRPERLEGGDAE